METRIKGYAICCNCCDCPLLQTKEEADINGVYVVYTNKKEAEEGARGLLDESLERPKVLEVLLSIK